MRMLPAAILGLSLATATARAQAPLAKDIVLLRFDVAEPILHLLKTRGRPATESIVGWVLVEHKIAYVALVDLDIEEAPQTAIGLLSRQPE